jgi:hypothetical protein
MPSPPRNSPVFRKLLAMRPAPFPWRLAHHDGRGQHHNVLALGFGLLIVFLVTGGSLWIMSNLNHNMMPMDQIMQMQR